MFSTLDGPCCSTWNSSKALGVGWCLYHRDHRIELLIGGQQDQLTHWLTSWRQQTDARRVTLLLSLSFLTFPYSFQTSSTIDRPQQTSFFLNTILTKAQQQANITIKSTKHNLRTILLNMFVLTPEGGSESGSNPSQLKTTAKFFGKLGLYFVAIRAAHVFFVTQESGNASS